MVKPERGGVPWEEIFEKADSGLRRGEIKGRSGLRLKYEVKDKPTIEFAVKDAVQKELELRAMADPADFSIGIQVRTRGFQGDPHRGHPDMFAGKFYRRALQILRKRYELVPTHFVEEWFDLPEYNDSYLVFKNEYAKTGNKVKAAQRTWSGRTLNNLEYSNVRNIAIEDNMVSAEFWNSEMTNAE